VAGFGALLACSVVLAAAPAGAQLTVPNINWTALLPALPSPPQTEPNRVAHCKDATMECVRTEIKRLSALRDGLGCDHRAVFATTYLELTREAKRTVDLNPGFFRWPRFFFREDALFANVYFRTMRRWDRGEDVPEAWRIALTAARDKDLTAAQDMLLGINAHVQNDMPYVLAQLGLRDRAGVSRKPDHDAVNEILNHAYAPVVSAVSWFDQSITLTNADWQPIEDVAGLEIVRIWREQVWRNAERLVNATSDAQRQRISQQIEDYAAQWANSIALVEVPGYRATRDEYCASHQLRG
jgi:hypothetical protein